MKKIRKDIIKSKLAEIIDGVNLVEDNLFDDFKGFINSGLVKDGIYKRIEFAIECIIDICNILNSDLDLGIPEDEEGILKNLENRKIFPKKTIDLIREMKGFRNLLVHKYGKLDDELAFENIKNGLKDFDFIIKSIENFLK